MKVGVLTLPLHTNYGGNLQAFALISVLKKNNIDVVFLDRKRNKYNPLRYLISVPAGLLKKHVLGKPAPIFNFIKAKREYDTVAVHANRFIEENIKPKSKPAYSGSDLLKICNEHSIDAMIVGSDQVWKPSYTPNIYEYFFDFLQDSNKKVKRVSYAASFGNDNWQYSLEQTKACGALLKQFDAVSVREDVAVEQCKSHFDVTASHVLDPSMLLDMNDYLALLEGKNLDKQNIINSYVLDKSPFIDDVFRQISDFYSTEVSKINSRTEEMGAPISERVAPPAEDWLHGIYTAKLLLTDSFHGCAFCILFNVPFIVIGNERRGIARFTSLLKLFDLESQMVKQPDDITHALNNEIDWQQVNEKLEKYRHKSMQYLLSSLGVET